MPPLQRRTTGNDDARTSGRNGQTPSAESASLRHSAPVTSLPSLAVHGARMGALHCTAMCSMRVIVCGAIEADTRIQWRRTAHCCSLPLHSSPFVCSSATIQLRAHIAFTLH